MRTQKYIQVEGIVAKYKDLASKAVKIETKEDEFMEFYVPSDFLRVLFVPQLIGYIYQLYAGEHAIEEVVKNYKIYTQYYVKGLLSEEEEAFLVENFDVFLDYIFRKDEYPTNVFDEFSTPSEWSSLVPYLFESWNWLINLMHIIIERYSFQIPIKEMNSSDWQTASLSLNQDLQMQLCALRHAE